MISNKLALLAIPILVAILFVGAFAPAAMADNPPNSEPQSNNNNSNNNNGDPESNTNEDNKAHKKCKPRCH